jgi:hypothetical protein
VIRKRDRRRRRILFNHPSIDLDRDVFGGHDFNQLPDDGDDADDYLYECAHCHCRVHGFEIEEGLWPARVGRYCMGLLMKEGAK